MGYKKMLKAHKSVPKRAVKIQRTAFGYQNKQHLAITALAIKSWNECIMGNGQTNSQPDGRTDKISNRRTHTHSRTTEGDRSKDGWLDWLTDRQTDACACFRRKEKQEDWTAWRRDEFEKWNLINPKATAIVRVWSCTGFDLLQNVWAALCVLFPSFCCCCCGVFKWIEREIERRSRRSRTADCQCRRVAVMTWIWIWHDMG